MRLSSLGTFILRMAPISRVTTRMLPFAILILFLCQLIRSEPQAWRTFDHQSIFLAQQRDVDGPPSSYQYRNCDFRIPGFSEESDFAVSDPRVRNKIGVIVATVKAAVEVAAACKSAGRKVAEAVPAMAQLALQGLPEHVSRTVRDVHRHGDPDPATATTIVTRLVWNVLHDKPGDPSQVCAQALDGSPAGSPPPQDFSRLLCLMARCYESTAASSSTRLQCLSELEKAAFDDLVFQKWPSNPGKAPAALLYASIYPSIVHDLLVERLRLDVQENRSSSRHDLSRFADRARTLAADIRERVFVHVLEDMFPLPFVNRIKEDELASVYSRREAVKQFAKGFARGDGRLGESTSRRLATTALRMHHDRKLSKKKPYPTDTKIAVLDARQKEKIMQLWDMKGFLLADVTYRLSSHAECELKTEHVCGHRTADGKSCNPHGRHGSNLPPCNYHCNRDVALATARVMQALVEEYYAQGALKIWELFLEPGTAVVDLLGSFQDAMRHGESLLMLLKIKELAF